MTRNPDIALIPLAFRLAADHIEANPQAFNFKNTFVPDCGTSGCAIGWADNYYFALGGRSFSDKSKYVIGHTAGIAGWHAVYFYKWMSQRFGEGWKQDSALCAKGMRLFASEILDYRKLPEEVEA